jgi:hypothetical protein
MARLRRGSRQDTEVEKMDRAMAKLDRRVRAEEQAEVEYEQNKIEAAEMLSECVAPDVSVQWPHSHPVQVPTWLPAPRNSRASRVPRVSPAL